ncbi:MAG TPA: hypothetical protein VMM93_06575 [Vicinamibacterales bacterium]|nr:hypothetical protein [Vicinamibacterales bacterium]
MPHRQLTIFTIGCWVALITAAVHMIGHLSGPAAPTNDTERQLLDLATNYRFPMPGGSPRSLMDFMNGFSLSFSVFMALTGAVGLIVRKRGKDDGVLMRAVARAIGGAGLVLTVIAVTQWFIVPSLFLALLTVCFLFAAVTPPK